MKYISPSFGEVQDQGDVDLMSGKGNRLAQTASSSRAHEYYKWSLPGISFVRAIIHKSSVLAMQSCSQWPHLSAPPTCEFGLDAVIENYR